MKRLIGVASAILVAFVLLAPTVLAADPLRHTGRAQPTVPGPMPAPVGG